MNRPSWSQQHRVVVSVVGILRLDLMGLPQMAKRLLRVVLPREDQT